MNDCKIRNCLIMVGGGDANRVASMNLQEMQLKSEKIGPKTAAELQLIQRKAERLLGLRVPCVSAVDESRYPHDCEYINNQPVIIMVVWPAKKVVDLLVSTSWC